MSFSSRHYIGVILGTFKSLIHVSVLFKPYDQYTAQHTGIITSLGG